MRVRKTVALPKTVVSDTGWKDDEDLQPRHAPYFTKTRPIRKHWKWRSVKAASEDGREFFLVILLNEQKGERKSVLCEKGSSGASVIGRLEYHESHPGVHLHSDCGRSGLELGPTGMDKLQRFPKRAGSYHRRTNAWTENGFLETSKRFFRITDRAGDLL